jgi:Methionine biosynthesis protein MetW
MHPPHAERILALLKPTDLVLDIGGWACPFNRANYVMDAEPYETRGFYGTFGGVPSQGGNQEWFTRKSWIRRDICDKTPYPFADKGVDFVICSQTLEDLRDPLWVCQEIVRIGKRGYIEVPSREAESCRGHEPGLVGLSHHRWLIDLDGSHLTFLMKFHAIHSHWSLSLPACHLRALSEERKITTLFWEGSFTASERTIHGTDGIYEELRGYIKRIRPYPPLAVGSDLMARRIAAGITWRLTRAAQNIGAVSRWVGMSRAERRGLE